MDFDRIFVLSVLFLEECLWVLAVAGVVYFMFILQRHHQSRWSKVGLNCSLIMLALAGLRTLWMLGITAWIELHPGVVLARPDAIPDQIWVVLSTVQATLEVAVALCALVIAIEARRRDRQVAEAERSL